jgi:hypothetical protein
MLEVAGRLRGASAEFFDNRECLANIHNLSQSLQKAKSTIGFVPHIFFLRRVPEGAFAQDLRLFSWIEAG